MAQAFTQIKWALNMHLICTKKTNFKLIMLLYLIPECWCCWLNLSQIAPLGGVVPTPWHNFFRLCYICTKYNANLFQSFKVKCLVGYYTYKVITNIYFILQVLHLFLFKHNASWILAIWQLLARPIVNIYSIYLYFLPVFYLSFTNDWKAIAIERQ